MKIKITYIISNVNKALAFEWLASLIDKNNFEIEFLLLNSGDSNFEAFLLSNNFKVTRITYKGKNDIIRSVFRIYKLLKSRKPDIVHTHLFDASLAGLIAARIAGIKKRIHTRHHSDYHHIYYPKAVKYDKIINFLSTEIISISKVVTDILVKKEHVKLKKISLVHHGFKMDKFINVPEISIKKLQLKYVPDESYPIIGVISRYIELKGIQYIIPAFKKLLKTHPKSLLILANAKGNYCNEIKKLLAEIPKDNYKEIEFEEDLFALYKLFDIYIHTPIDKNCEAFGQTYIEALATKTPSIYTLSGIANEFIKDDKNALVVNYMSSEDILEKIIMLLNDKELCQKITSNGQIDVIDRFDIVEKIKQLEQIYLKINR